MDFKWTIFLVCITVCFSQQEEIVGRSDSEVAEMAIDVEEDLQNAENSENNSSVKVMDHKSFEVEKQKSDRLMIVYFKSFSPKEDSDEIQLQRFLDNFNRSSLACAKYDLDFYLVSCPEVDDDHSKECSKDGSDEFARAFRNGQLLLSVGFDNLFDVDSIISNFLQLLFLGEVSIIQTWEAIEEAKEQSLDQYDIALLYTNVIGTTGHRLFLEAYHDLVKVDNENYKFFITTEKAVIGNLLESDGGETEVLWVLACGTYNLTGAAACEHYAYKAGVDHSAIDFLYLFQATPTWFVGNVSDLSMKTFYFPRVFLLSSGPTEQLDHDESINMCSRILFEEFRGFIWIVMMGSEFIENVTAEIPGCQPPALLYGDQEHMLQCFDLPEVRQEILDLIGHRLEQNFSYRKKHSRMMSNANDDDSTSDVEVEDDEVNLAALTLRMFPPDLANVTELSDTTADDFIDSASFAVVLYYLEFDSVSRSFLHIFVNASNAMAAQGVKPFGLVNCFDWTYLCRQHGVTVYPTVRTKQQGEAIEDYKGLLDLGELLHSVQLMFLPSISIFSSFDDYDQLLLGSGIYRYIKPFTVIALLKGENSAEKLQFELLAKRLHGVYHFASASGDLAGELSLRYACNMPCLIALNRGHLSSHRVIPLSASLDLSATADLIRTYSLPLLAEITVSSFPLLHTRSRPFALLFVRNSTVHQKVMDRVQQYASKISAQNLSFAWMQTMGPTGYIAQEIMLTYDRQAKLPALFYLNLKKGLAKRSNLDIFDGPSVCEWLVNIDSGILPVQTNLPLGSWEPLLPSFNFLNKIDEENSMQNDGSDGSMADEDWDELPSEAGHFRQGKTHKKKGHEAKQQEDDGASQWEVHEPSQWEEHEASQWEEHEASQWEGHKADKGEGHKASQWEGQEADQGEGHKAGQWEGQEAGQWEGQEAGQGEGQEAGQGEGQDAGQGEGQEAGQGEGQEANRREGTKADLQEGHEIDQRKGHESGDSSLRREPSSPPGVGQRSPHGHDGVEL